MDQTGILDEIINKVDFDNVPTKIENNKILEISNEGDDTAFRQDGKVIIDFKEASIEEIYEFSKDNQPDKAQWFPLLAISGRQPELNQYQIELGKKDKIFRPGYIGYQTVTSYNRDSLPTMNQLANENIKHNPEMAEKARKLDEEANAKKARAVKSPKITRVVSPAINSWVNSPINSPVNSPINSPINSPKITRHKPPLDAQLVSQIEMFFELIRNNKFNHKDMNHLVNVWESHLDSIRTDDVDDSMERYKNHLDGHVGTLINNITASIESQYCQILTNKAGKVCGKEISKGYDCCIAHSGVKCYECNDIICDEEGYCKRHKPIKSLEDFESTRAVECTYLLGAGANKGNSCGKKPEPGYCLCSRHLKITKAKIEKHNNVRFCDVLLGSGIRKGQHCNKSCAEGHDCCSTHKAKATLEDVNKCQKVVKGKDGDRICDKNCAKDSNFCLNHSKFGNSMRSKIPKEVEQELMKVLNWTEEQFKRVKHYMKATPISKDKYRIISEDGINANIEETAKMLQDHVNDLWTGSDITLLNSLAGPSDTYNNVITRVYGKDFANIEIIDEKIRVMHYDARKDVVYEAKLILVQIDQHYQIYKAQVNGLPAAMELNQEGYRKYLSIKSWTSAIINVKYEEKVEYRKLNKHMDDGTSNIEEEVHDNVIIKELPLKPKIKKTTDISFTAETSLQEVSVEDKQRFIIIFDKEIECNVNTYFENTDLAIMKSIDKFAKNENKADDCIKLVDEFANNYNDYINAAFKFLDGNFVGPECNNRKSNLRKLINNNIDKLEKDVSGLLERINLPLKEDILMSMDNARRKIDQAND